MQSVRGIKAKDGKGLILSGRSTLTSALLSSEERAHEDCWL